MKVGFHVPQPIDDSVHAQASRPSPLSGERVAGAGSGVNSREQELLHSNQILNSLYRIAESLNQATCEHELLENLMDRVLELPGVRAGWISLRVGETGFRMGATRNLPPALQVAGAFDGLCECRRRLLSGELEACANIIECERLDKASADTGGMRNHASVPLWLGNRTLGAMNLVGPDQGMFSDADLRVLHSIGHQAAVALERAELRQRLEQLVEEKTATLEAEIVVRKRIEKEQARLSAILEATPDFVATGGLDGRVFYMNPAGRRMIGIDSKVVPSALPVGAGHPEWALKLVTETGIPQAIEHGAWRGETAFRGGDGKEIPVSQVIIAHRDGEGALEYLSTIARDISLQKAYENRITRLNRVYAVLSGINTTIVRTPNRQELFDTACRIAVEHGKFRMAWIGLLEANGRDVVPAASADAVEGYLCKIQLNAGIDVPEQCEVVMQALREKAAVVCNDIDADARMVRWREEAQRGGYRSMVVFPLQLNDEIVGLLALYAAETDFFDTEEIRLLAEVAGDISFALDHLDKANRISYLAYYDALTGLPNRALFQERLTQRVAASQNGQNGFVVIALNLERFRSINDTLGQHAGDELLRQVALSLQVEIGEADVLARIGGDSFAIVMRCLDGEEGGDSGVGRILERVLSRIQDRSFEIGGQELRVAAKAGGAVFPADGKDGATLMRNAEAALARARLSGERYLFYAPEFNARVAEKLALENKLRRALERGELVLHYQPKVDLKKRHINGMEALMRWNDPDTGLLVPPIRFIPILEETGLIIDAGRWAMEQALADSLRCLRGSQRMQRIAVNVSAIQLRDKNFVATVERALRGAMDANRVLELEITESLIMQDVDDTIRKLQAVRDMGVEISVDDFGTGYSSLAYISRLPINTLKIDRAFIMNMTSNPDDLSIVSTIISLGHSLELKVVAEGVETEEQANLLRLLKCDQMQGYLFSRPVPVEQIEVLLKQGSPASSATN